MHAQLHATLAGLRARRGFDAGRCLQAKIALLVRYFRRSALTTAVVGVSGGVDSAVVLGLLVRAARPRIRRSRGSSACWRPTSTSRRVSAIRHRHGARGGRSIRTFAAECIELDLSRMHAVAKP
jgi:NH3-dependent NAD+ synthetase